MVHTSKQRHSSSLLASSPWTVRGPPGVEMPLARGLRTARKSLADVRSMIICEDNHIIALNKPPGLLCQRDRTSDPDLHSMVLEYLPTAYAALVHRLDRPTSGCVLVSKTSKAAARLAEAFRDRRVDKLYLVVVDGLPAHGAAWLVDTIRQPAGSHARAGAAVVQPRAVVPCVPVTDLSDIRTLRPPSAVLDACMPERHEDVGQHAALRYDVIQADKTQSLLAVQLHTGRRHQIRAQLATHGSCVVGDRRYGEGGDGSPPGTLTSHLALHAVMLSAPHPVKARGELQLTAPLPSTWERICTPSLLQAGHQAYEELIRTASGAELL